MAYTIGNDAEYIDFPSSSGITRHMLKDAQARSEIADLKANVNYAYSNGSNLPYIPLPGVLGQNGVWVQPDISSHVSIPVNGGDTIEITAGLLQASYYGFLKTDNYPEVGMSGVAIDYANGEARTVCAVGQTISDTVPQDATVLCINYSLSGNTDYYPKSIKINGIEINYGLKNEINKNRSAISDVVNKISDVNTYSIWVQGGFYSDGSTATTQTAIRTSVFQTFKDVSRIECADGYFFVLYAWNDNTYIGMWTGSGFSSSAYARNTALDMSKIVADYPAYKYRLALRHADTTVAIAPADGANCKFVTSKIPAYIMPVDGADMTSVITAALTKYGSVELGPGTFLINNIVMPDFTTLKGQGRATKLVVGNYHTHGITAGKGCTIENLEIDGKASVIPNSKGDSAGIAIISDGETDYYNIKISNVTIYGFNLAGIYAYKTGYWCADSVSAINCEMRYCYAGIFCDANAEYGRYTNILVYGCNFGALVNGGNNKFVNCDFTNNNVGFYLNAHADGTVNNGHGSCVGCTFNHSGNNAGNAIIANSVTNGYVFSGCQIHYGILYIENSAGILFDGCNFGTDVGVTDYTNTALLFIGCTFKAVPTKTGNNQARYVNCYLLDGGAVT